MAKSQEPYKSFIWITGNYYDCRKKWSEVVAALKDPHIETLDCGFNPEDCSTPYSNANDVIRVLRTLDMFEERPRIVRMRGLPPDYTKITEHLKYATPTNMLVVDAPVGYYGGKRFNSAAASNFYKAFSSQGTLCKYDIEVKSPSTAVAWVKRVSKELGKEIEQDAADLLVAMKGCNLDLLYSELTKLHAFEAGKKITAAGVQECCVPAFLRSVWELIDALDYQRFDDVCTHLQEFHQNAGIEVGTSVRGDAEQMLGALSYHYELLLHAKDCCPKTLTYNGFTKGVADLKKLNKEADRDDNADNDEPEKESKPEKAYGPKFNPGGIAMALHNAAFLAAYKWPKSKVYAALRDTIRCRWKLRALNPDTNKIRLWLDSLCMSICGKLTETDFLTILEYPRRDIQRITALVAE